MRVVTCFSVMLILVLGVISFTGGSASLFSSQGPQQVFQQAVELEERGDFQGATKLINDYLKEKGEEIDKSWREKLQFEVERIERIRLDYRLTGEKLLEQLTSRIKDFKPEELDRWEQEGKIDFKVIDGQKLYVRPTVSNLFFRYKDIWEGKISKDSGYFARLIWNNYLKMKELGETSPSPLIYPQKYLIKMTVTVDKGVVDEGETIRCWMPFPRHCPLQSDITFIEAKPAVKWLAEPQSLIRSAYFEQPAQKEEPTRFSLSYMYTCYSYCSQIDAARIEPYDKEDPNYIKYTKEQPPHVVFIPEFKDLSQQIIGQETNPYHKAQKLYDWVSKNIVYSYAREYSTLRNISQYCFEHRYGDCGQEGLLFITLCRLNGVPARWQSGWVTYPQEENLHDWTEIYLPPYGWVPVDPYMGLWAYTLWEETLTAEQKEQLRQFYFGNLDHFRLVINNDHGQKLYPPKHSFRSDTVDFQRGELESQGKNIYFNEFDYYLDCQLLPMD